MTLFFFISGIYVPSSLARKGAARFLADRTLRLVLPCLAYSLLLAPLQIWMRQLAAAAAAPPATAAGAAAAAAASPSLRAVYAAWLAPGWPTTYLLPTGPPW